MEQLSKEIDQKIEVAERKLDFETHFKDWWQESNRKCGDLYKKAGEEDPSSICPTEAVKWLNEQVKKLHNFLAEHAAVNKTL